jgi:4-amino-4-deoxy-L-arabinose transferase-like glycosyltransferase
MPARFQVGQYASGDITTEPTVLQPQPPAIGARQLTVRWRARRVAAEWSPGGLRWDILSAGLILLLAGVLRFYKLTTIPLGFQGDESSVGLEAHRIMREGWIGVFTPVSGGVPAAFYYLAVIPVRLLGDTVFSIRVISATLDLLSVLCLYILLRRAFGWGTAVAGTLFLACSGWHIQFSRIAFPNIMWPLTVLIGAIALSEAVRSDSRSWWALAGAGFAFGIYTYNGDFLYLGIVGLAMAWILFGWSAALAAVLIGGAYVSPSGFALVRVAIGLGLLAMNERVRTRRQLRAAASFAIGFGVVVWPMAKFILGNQETYFGRGKGVTIFRTEQWTTLGSLNEKASFLARRYVDFWDTLTRHPVLDGVAGNGSHGVVPVTAVVLAAVGIAFAVARRMHPIVLLGTLTVLLAPLATVASNDFALRRSMIVAPFLAMFGGIAVTEIIRISWNRRVVVRVAAMTIVLALSGNIGYRNVHDYFTDTARSQSTRWVMGPEIVATARYLDTLPAGAYVYFFSMRWPFTYETIRYFAPDAHGETRGAPYGPNSIEIDPANGAAVFVLLDQYQARLPEIQERYPGGEKIVGPRLTNPDTGPTFIAYALPTQHPTAP